MKKETSNITGYVVLLLVGAIIGYAIGGGSLTGEITSRKTYLGECKDGVDNDGDGAIDSKDPGCKKGAANDESNCGDGVCEGVTEYYGNCPLDCGEGQTECDDKYDNDDDGLIDLADPGCSSEKDTSEYNTY